MPFLVSLLKDAFSVVSGEELLNMLAMWFLNHALHPSLLIIEGLLLRVTNQLSYPSSSSDKIYAVARAPQRFSQNSSHAFLDFGPQTIRKQVVLLWINYQVTQNRQVREISIRSNLTLASI